MSYARSERVQELSAAVFGQRHRLALMAAIAQSDDGVVNPSDLVEMLQLRAQSSLQGPFNSLLAAGLVTRISGIGDRVYYRREASAAWEFALELLGRALREDAQLDSVATPGR